MAESPERERIANRYGFNSFAELFDISNPLPMTPDDTARSYVAKHPKRHWFVWEDVPHEPFTESEKAKIKIRLPTFRVIGVRSDGARVTLQRQATEDAAADLIKRLTGNSNFQRFETEAEPRG